MGFLKLIDDKSLSWWVKKKVQFHCWVSGNYTELVFMGVMETSGLRAHLTVYVGLSHPLIIC